MTKKNGRTANGTTYQLERDKHTTQPTRCATKHELVAVHLLEQGAQGVSALSGLAGLRDLNTRNSVSLLRREHGIEIADAFFEHQHSGGGTVRLKNYWLADREQAQKLVALINHWRKQRNAAPLADDHAAVLCARSPEAAPLPPAA
ncbi:hypothetical protein H4N55_11135 [Aeromonas veronii]|uniref:hypothetical protein n=1 Tax=Aeromonas veronii TaxID=654 RepID=UPI00188BC53D|nr:hypothetical protein [Aeromonas veronii]MBF3237154.1 hypothetical protein [Aeromonas veronii]